MAGVDRNGNDAGRPWVDLAARLDEGSVHPEGAGPLRRSHQEAIAAVQDAGACRGPTVPRQRVRSGCLGDRGAQRANGAAPVVDDRDSDGCGRGETVGEGGRVADSVAVGIEDAWADRRGGDHVGYGQSLGRKRRSGKERLERDDEDDGEAPGGASAEVRPGHEQTVWAVPAGGYGTLRSSTVWPAWAYGAMGAAQSDFGKAAAARSQAIRPSDFGMPSAAHAAVSTIRFRIAISHSDFAIPGALGCDIRRRAISDQPKPCSRPKRSRPKLPRAGQGGPGSSAGSSLEAGTANLDRPAVGGHVGRR